MPLLPRNQYPGALLMSELYKKLFIPYSLSRYNEKVNWNRVARCEDGDSWVGARKVQRCINNENYWISITFQRMHISLQAHTQYTCTHSILRIDLWETHFKLLLLLLLYAFPRYSAWCNCCCCCCCMAYTDYIQNVQKAAFCIQCIRFNSACFCLSCLYR